VAAPRTAAARSLGELVAQGRELGYPLVLKNLEPFTRLRRPAVGHTTMVPEEAALPPFPAEGGQLAVLAQEYLPAEQAEDWFTHLYCGVGGESVVFTGFKRRSWPPGAGVTTRAAARGNSELAAQALEFCRRIGYRGVADLDWRLDLRDGQYKLVDFNPRVGAQFRLFETVHGVDVVRALHLDLTGREVPQGPQVAREFVVGQLDLLSRAATARSRRPSPGAPSGGRQRAWLSLDDPVPALAEAARFTGRAALHAARLAAGPVVRSGRR
jgi:predicted ATP-grasp superfamily ATP-dependent carboligase